MSVVSEIMRFSFKRNLLILLIYYVYASYSQFGSANAGLLYSASVLCATISCTSLHFRIVKYSCFSCSLSHCMLSDLSQVLSGCDSCSY